MPGTSRQKHNSLTRKGVPKLREPALVCLSAIDKKSVYWSHSWARILTVQNIIKERTKETSSNISSTCIPSTTIAGAGQHWFNTCLRCTSYRGCSLPTKFRFNVGAALQPIAVQCRSIVYDAGPTLIYHRVCCVLCANTWLSTNAVSMLNHSLRRWPVIETALGDCTGFFLTAALCWWRFNILAPGASDNTIHWPSADVMLGHFLRRWANSIPTKTR